MKITCSQKPRSGSHIAIITNHGQLVDAFDAPTSNGLLYCMSKTYGKYTRRLKAAVAIASRLEEQPAPTKDESDDEQNQLAA